MSQRTVAVNFTANTTPYIAGVTKANAATGAMSKAVMTAATRFLGPAGLVMALTKAGKSAIDFDTEVTKLSTQIGLTTDEVNELRTAALTLGGATTKAPQELAEAAFFVASAGLRGAAAMDVLRMSARLSAVGLGETKVVADTLTSAVNAYGEENISAAQASDVLLNAVRLGKAGAEELAGSLGKVLPIASAMGVSFDEVGGIVAAMTRTGTDAATATTQLRAIMTSLLKPTNQAADAMIAMGTSAGAIRAQIEEEGLWAALMTLHDATDGNADAFAQLFPNVRALAGVMDLLGPQLESNAELMAEMATATGTAEEAFATYSLTTRAEMDRLGASFQRLMISVGDSTTGFAAQGSRALTNIVTNLADAMERKNDKDAFAVRVLGDHAIAMDQLKRMTEGLSGAQLQAVLDSDEYAAALREVETTGRALTGVESDLAREVRMRAFLTRDATEFDHERIAAQERLTREALASLDPMRAQNAEAERWNGLADRYASGMMDAAGAQAEFAESAEEAAQALKDQLTLIDQQRDAIRRTVDPMYNLVRSQQDLQEAQGEVNRMMTEGVEEGEDLSEAILDLMLKHIDYDHALATSEANMDGFVGTLNTMTEDGRLTQEMLDVLIERVAGFGTELDKIDGRVTRSTHIHTVITEAAFWETGGMAGHPALAEMRALGGPVKAGQPYIVGERGPELMVPSTAGDIIPAGQLARMMSGGVGPSGPAVVIESYTTVRELDDDALVRKLEFAQMAGRL